jgi:hypothetical protein
VACEVIYLPDIHWRVPVYVKDGNGAPKTIRGPEQALRCLGYRWPVSTSAAASASKLRCFMVLQERSSCEAARAAFIDAAIKARIWLS